ncbi:MAG: hypothetical protein GC191_07515 [Azospirillum sp.]|nr:hypothetical protein [Azospirillum sp.]
MAELGRAFGMDAVFTDRNGAPTVRHGYCRFDDVIGTTDVLSLHCPLTAETQGLSGLPEFHRIEQRPQRRIPAGAGDRTRRRVRHPCPRRRY